MPGPDKHGVKSWRYDFFVLSFLAALGAAISSIKHTYDNRKSGNVNAFTPAFMLVVKAMKIPELYSMYSINKSNNSNESKASFILVVGALIACILWGIAFFLAIT